MNNGIFHKSPCATCSSDPPRRIWHCWMFHHIVEMFFWLPCSCFLCCCCISIMAPVVERLWGVIQDKGVGCAELRRRITVIELLSWGGTALFICTHTYTHTCTHWDYGNAGGLEQKHSPLPVLLSFARVNVMLSTTKFNGELVTFSQWYLRLYLI